MREALPLRHRASGRGLPFGVVVVCGFALLAVAGPWLAPYSPYAIDLEAQYQLPNARHWLGTSDNGVDVLSVLLCGARLSGLVALCSVGISLLLGAALGALLSGAVIAEKIFERPGLGTLFLDAFFDRDIPVVQGCVLVIAISYVALNLLVDLLYGVVDPRVRLA